MEKPRSSVRTKDAIIRIIFRITKHLNAVRNIVELNATDFYVSIAASNR